MPALSVVADYSDGKRKMVEYYTYIAAKSSVLEIRQGMASQQAGLKMKFGMSVPQDKFDKLRKPFDTIVDSLKGSSREHSAW